MGGGTHSAQRNRLPSLHDPIVSPPAMITAESKRELAENSVGLF